MAYDRQLLLGPKRGDVLSLAEVVAYGTDSFGDPDYVSLYGLTPPDWYGRGARILGRTAVECTRDGLARLIAEDVAGLARRAPLTSAFVLDSFAGSANTLFWIHRQLAGSVALGFELDEKVFQATVRNMSILGLDLELRRTDYRVGIDGLEIPEDELLVVFVAPPWGDALSEAGLDLERTTPPVSRIVDLFDQRFPRHRLLVAVQVFELVEPASLPGVSGRFDWSTRRTYDLDPPGRNHGLLLGTIRWRP